MKVEVTRDTPTLPPVTGVSITLSRDEAVILRTILGYTSASTIRDRAGWSNDTKYSFMTCSKLITALFNGLNVVPYISQGKEHP